MIEQKSDKEEDESSLSEVQETKASESSSSVSNKDNIPNEILHYVLSIAILLINNIAKYWQPNGYRILIVLTLITVTYFKASCAWLIFVWLVLGSNINLVFHYITPGLLNSIAKKYDLKIRSDKRGVENVFLMSMMNAEETMGYINNILETSWIFSISKLVERDILESLLNKIIKDMKLKYLEKYPWSKYILLQYDDNKNSEPVISGSLGPNSPWITGITIYTDAATDKNTYISNSFTFDIGMYLHLLSDSELFVCKILQHLKVGIKELKISGMVRIKLTPLFRSDFGGNMEVSVMGVPDVDFNFGGFLSVLNLSIIKMPVLYILNFILGMFVHPVHVKLPMVSENKLKQCCLSLTPPIGTIRVKIIEGKDILAADQPVMACGTTTSDPYCTVELENHIKKTSIQKRTTEPKWNFQQDFPITIKNYNEHEVRVNIYDWDWSPYNPDDELGFCSLSIKEIVDNCTIDEWYALGSGGEGKVRIITEFLPIIEESPTIENWINVNIPKEISQTHAILSIVIVESRMSLECQPMVILELSGHHAHQTSRGQPGSQNWEFAEEFIFPLRNVMTDRLLISLVDYGKGRTATGLSKMKEKIRLCIMEPHGNEESESDCDPSLHRLLAKKNVNMDYFTSYEQLLYLTSNTSGIYSLKIIGQVTFIRNE